MLASLLNSVFCILWAWSFWCILFHVQHVTQGGFGKNCSWSKPRALKTSRESQRRSTLLLRCFEDCLSLLSSRMIKSNWIFEWQLDCVPLSDLIESSHFLHDFLLIFMAVDGQTGGIPHPLSPPTYLSLIFQTLLICPGHLSEKILTFKSFRWWNSTRRCFQPSGLPCNFQDMCVSVCLSSSFILS